MAKIKPKTKKWPIIIGVLVICGVIGKCGGSNDTPSPAPTLRPKPTPVATATPIPTPNWDNVAEVEEQVKVLFDPIIAVEDIEGRPNIESLSIILQTAAMAELYERCQTYDEEAWQQWDNLRATLASTSEGVEDIMDRLEDSRTVSVQIIGQDGASYMTFLPDRILYDALDSIKEQAAAERAQAEKEAEEQRKREEEQRQKEDGATSSSQSSERTYILNTSTKVFHLPSCSSADKISSKNRSSDYGTRADMIARGYKACGNCHP